MVFRKIASTFISKVIAALCNLLLLYITIRYMGAEVRGNISLMILHLSFVMLFSEWVAGPVLVYFFANKNTKQLLTLSYRWILLTALLSFLALIYLQPIYTILPFVLLSFFQCAISLHNQVLIGFGKILEQNAIQLMQPIFTLLLVLLHVFMGIKNVEAYIHSFLISSIITYLIQLAIYMRIPKNDSTELIGFISIAKSGSYTTATNVAHLLTNRLSYFYINSILGATALGVYSTGVSLSEAILMAASSAGMVHYSTIANSADETNNKKQTVLFAKYSILITLLLCVIVYFIPNQLFISVLGKDFSQTKQFILMYSPGIFAMSLTLVFSHYFSGSGNFKIPFIAGLSSCIVIGTFAKSIVSIYEEEGMIVLTSVGLIIQLLILYYYFVRKKIN